VHSNLSPSALVTLKIKPLRLFIPFWFHHFELPFFIHHITPEMILAPRLADSKEKNWKVAQRFVANQLPPSNVTYMVLCVMLLQTE